MKQWTSQKEQFSIVLRYFTDEIEILEEFIGFVHLRDGLSGRAIADAILKKISDLGLDIMNCRGQGLSLIHISEPTRLLSISYAVFCLKKKND